MALRDNGTDYEVLTNAVRSIKGVGGMTCEIGLREGGGSKYIIDALIANGDEGRTHIAIDPYGSIPYIQAQNHAIGDNDGGTGPYPNKMMKFCLSELYGYIYEKNIEVLFFPLEDVEFYKRYSDGIPAYHDCKKFYKKAYALTYLDGPHDLHTTMEETQWFGDRTSLGGALVYDDIVNYYDHDAVREYLLGNGWQELETVNSKAAYKKISGEAPPIEERIDVYLGY